MIAHFKKYGLLIMVALLYLSNTGLAYHVHTCLHSGKKNIEWIHSDSEHDNCNTIVESCADDGMDCCIQSDAQKKADCHEHTLEFKKLTFFSVKPEIKTVSEYVAIVPPSWLYDFVSYNSSNLYLTSELIPGSLNWHRSIIRTGLEHRIVLSSFIC